MEPSLEQIQQDINFTEDISNKMQIPSRLSIKGPIGRTSSWGPNMGDGYAGNSMMEVPDTILVAGSDKHVELPRNQKYRPSSAVAEEVMNTANLGLGDRSPRVDVEPPPTSMVLGKVEYPDIDSRTKSRTGYEASDSDFFEDESLAALQRQLESLRHRVRNLEQEGEQRNQRDRFLYSAVGALILLKLCSFLLGGRAG